MSNNRNLGALANRLDEGSTGDVLTKQADGSAQFAAVAGGGATGGGTDEVFYENGTNVTTDYTITNGKNAMSAGPITIDNGVTVTVGTGETWTVV
jgi:CO dehydrogenase/acetyl-CoA synthase gamma subunit (corrinoid Fe-S protein)